MKPRSYVELQRHLDVHAKPLHGQPVPKVTQRAIVELLQKIAQAAPVAANRVRASLSAMFAWGMKAGLVTANPVTATFKPAEETPRERVLTNTELRLIWACTGGDHGHDRIVRLLLVTGARREEIAGMAWSEITTNPAGTATWILPGLRSKNGLAHELVLPPMVAALLPPERKGADGEVRALLFGEGDGPFSGWSRCKGRLDARLAEANAKAEGAKAPKPIPAWVLHDLRRTFVTRLNDLGVEPHIVEALVNHSSGAARAGVASVHRPRRLPGTEAGGAGTLVRPHRRAGEGHSRQRTGSGECRAAAEGRLMLPQRRRHEPLSAKLQRGRRGQLKVRLLHYRAERLKAKLRQQHANGPAGYLSGQQASPSREIDPAATARFQPRLPDAVRRAVERADRLMREALPVGGSEATPTPCRPEQFVMWTTHAANPARKHRPNGMAKGRHPNDDAGLASAVHTLRNRHNLSLHDAGRRIAEWLAKTENISLKSALARVLKTLRRDS